MLTRLTLCFCLTVAAVSQPPASQSAAIRSTALNNLFKDVWEDDLKHSPEFASALGDRRYNDQLSDLSARAFNDALARRRDFLSRLIAIDTTGLSEPDRSSADLMRRQLIEEEEYAPTKPWELPINQFHNLAVDLPAQLVFAPFETVKDYDDYVARLHLIPALIRQVSEDLLAGIDDHRVQPAAMLQQTLTEIEAIANETAADSPFAAPLEEFPAGFDPAQQKRISAAVLAAIGTDAIPAYIRLAKFLKIIELPAASTTQSTPQPYQLSGDQLRRTKIIGLLIKAETALGPKFDLKAFYNLIAANSALPLEALELRVDRWISGTK